MAIPIMTKEEIFTSIKDINTIKDDKRISDAEFNDLVLTLHDDAEGFCKGYILQNYHTYITHEAWRSVIRLFIKWTLFSQCYSSIWQTLADNSYIQLKDLLNEMNNNFSMQAKQEVTPNKMANFKVYNPS